MAEHHFRDPLAFEVLRILAFYFLGYNLLELCTSLFTSFQDTFSSGLMGFCQQFSTLIFVIVFRTTASLDIVSYSYAWIIGVAVAIVAGLVIVARKYRHVLTGAKLKRDGKFMKSYVKYALWAFLVVNVSVLLGSVNQQIVVNVL